MEVVDIHKIHIMPCTIFAYGLGISRKSLV